MGKYILKRVGYAILTVFALLTITFFLMQLLPGTPFMGDKAISPATEAALMAKYGLDKPVWQQYLMYLGNFVKGDLGISIKYNRPIMTIIKESFPISAELGLRSLVIAVVFGIFLGSVAAIKRGKWQDTGSMLLAIIGVSIPSFIIGALLQFVLAVKFRTWFGFTYFPVNGWKSEAHKILPAIALAFGSMATVARLMRTSMLDVLGQDYIKTAKAKGLSQPAIIMRHGIRNAILPVITVLGPIVASVLTGAFVVAEQIRQAVAEVAIHGENHSPIRVTVSIGVSALRPLQDDTPEMLIQAADQALYAAKDGGRNCVRRHLPRRERGEAAGVGLPAR